MEEVLRVAKDQPTRRMLLIFCCLCVALIGCGGRDYDGPPRYAVSGIVTMDGEPIEPGYIGFFPQTNGEAAPRVAGGPIRDGKYSIEESNGPNAGTYRIEIHWNKPTGREVVDPYGDKIPQLTEGVPAKYHGPKSELTAEVSSQQTTFDFELSSK